ncbi:hypothetical protein F751_6301 [Auxenochlorella protothecoides]|uniref:ShKT domain-containing protein n=1 Tax=Auxenochlorella protothecoides TaxID=3075 RepID=A0A087SSS6_AUXPR|nr:hypothetical protein F751_6301 [Auxenochlorella protothecoides]KFM28780.1 hypothetical protein F751_6301 [Auxenochlorella protothecoides]
MALCRPLLGLMLLLGLALDGEAGSSVHTVFPTECTRYFTWQSMGMMLSHRLAGQPGPLTRIMSCTHEELEAMSPEERNICPTHVAPSYTVHPRTGDIYSAYNKPVAVIDWLARTEIKEEYVLIIDADMIMLTPFLPDEVGASRGWAVSAYFSYMKGVNNELALKHVPEVTPRNDTLAGPRGRRGDMVGGFTLMHSEDLRRVAPLWLKYSEDVRFDPDAWTLSGDHYSVNKGDRPWISEMYGYSYAASKSDVWHHVDHSAMLYPGYNVKVLPKVLHYGLKIEVPNTPWVFDKHYHYDFDAMMCPPWDLNDPPAGKKGGLFPRTPHPDSFKGSDSDVLRDLLAIQTVVVLNAAFCERHEKACPPSEQLSTECAAARSTLDALQRRMKEQVDRMPDPCRNSDTRCEGWAKAGECQKNEGWMADYCSLACAGCKPKTPPARPGTKAPVLTDGEGAGLKKGGGVGLLRGATDAGVLAGKDTAKDAGAATDAVSGGDSGGAVPAERVERLRARCTRQPHWSMGAVKACLAAASKGREYQHPSEASRGAGVGSETVRTLGERTRRLVAGAGQSTAGAAGSVLHTPGILGFVVWALVLLVLLASLPRVRKSLATPVALGNRTFFGRRGDKSGRSE